MSKIMLDAGHGGTDSGAVGCDGRYEKDDVLRLVLAIGELLSNRDGVDVCYTRTTDVFDNVDVKAKKGNEAGVDFFASFHRNSASETANGYETLVYSDEGDAHTFAEYANARMDEIGFRHRGTKIRTDLAVLKRTNMPAALCEVGFVTNESDNDLFESRFNDIVVDLANACLTVLGKPTIDSSDDYEAEVDITENDVEESVEVEESSSSSRVEWIAELQAECNAQGFSNQVVDGIAGPNTLAGCPDIKYNASGNITKILQQQLEARGYSVGSCGCDGICGNDTQEAIKAFQRDNGLDADGICGPKTWAKILGL